MKEPAARALEELKSEEVPRRDAGAKIIDVWYNMLGFVANKPFKETHAQMSVGYVSVSSGLVAASREMGIIAKVNSTDDREQPAEGTRIKLGSTQIQYHMRPRVACAEAVEIAQFVVDHSGPHENWRWPTEIAEISSFAETTLKMTRAFRSHRVGDGKYGLRGGVSEQHEYLCQHFLRLVLMIVAMMIPGAFDEFSMSKIAGWTPDKRNLIQEIEHLTGKEAERPADSLKAIVGPSAEERQFFRMLAAETKKKTHTLVYENQLHHLQLFVNRYISLQVSFSTVTLCSVALKVLHTLVCSSFGATRWIPRNGEKLCPWLCVLV